MDRVRWCTSSYYYTWATSTSEGTMNHKSVGTVPACKKLLSACSSHLFGTSATCDSKLVPLFTIIRSNKGLWETGSNIGKVCWISTGFRQSLKGNTVTVPSRRITTSFQILTIHSFHSKLTSAVESAINPLKPELNPICYLLALLGAHHSLHVSRIRVKLLTFRLLMS